MINLCKKLENIISELLTIIFPDKCIFCNKKGGLLCELCIAKTRHPERDLATDIYAACDYRDPQIKKALLSLKYYKKRRLALILGGILYERLMEEISNLRIYTRGSPIVLVPIPLSKKRYKERGYNQANEIALGLKEYSENCLGKNREIFEINKNLVEKWKDTKAQAKIANRNERIENIKNCFRINPEKELSIKGRTVIVIDDITTTGSTLNEVMAIIKENGAKKVVGFAVAH